MRPKTKLFAVKFRHVVKFFACMVCKKKFWAHFHDLCVQKRSILQWSSDAFCKFSAWMVCKKKFWAHFHDLCIRKRNCLLWCLYAFGKFSPCKVYETCSVRIFTIARAHKSLLCCSGPLRSPWLCILLKCLESGHILTTSAPTNCDVQGWFQVKEFFEKDLEWHHRHILWYLSIEKKNRFCEILPKLNFLAKLNLVVHRGLILTSTCVLHLCTFGRQ